MDFATVIRSIPDYPKKGKLPWNVLGEDYALEYGTDRIEIHQDAIKRGEHVIVVDDLIASGGTCFAAIKLLEQAGAEVVGCSVVIDLPDLGGADKIRALGKGGDDARHLLGALRQRRFV
jgi:adenine phosphoribosyltransferase